MGSTFSVFNDSEDEFMFVKVGIAWDVAIGAAVGAASILSLGAASAVAGAVGGSLSVAGSATAIGGYATTAFAIKGFCEALIKAGYTKMDSGGTFYSKKLTLSLVQDVEVIMVNKNNGHRRSAKKKCWTGPTANSNLEYFLHEFDFEDIP